MSDQVAGAGRSPLDVACPHCAAVVGRSCSTGTGFEARTHAGRWRAIGVRTPTTWDREAEWTDRQRRRALEIEETYAGLHARLFGGNRPS